jgi:hypothetical protein
MATRGTLNETSRLTNKETDWNLVGGALTETRTRGGGGSKRKQPVESSSSSSDGEWKDDGENEDDEDAADEVMILKSKEKPLHERVILEVKHVELAFEKFSRCPECDEPLVLCCSSTQFVLLLDQTVLGIT